ncbi:FKBP-type peptidyl-prolyl cis-trans isomerase [Sphingomonas endolithica]|uniref:FKBP-type peptidyl-prolyl cis-trans isomerase n=1 Tax=Sphingomonas endolithica TaxID=2972485 RepID=UPI0021AFBD14|nr:FKBP-type peptidyl-prolyl cis-trans isomerase [Sphingomonas sp. ZFBP2030]
MTTPTAALPGSSNRVKIRYLLIGMLVGALATAVLALLFRPAPAGGVPVSAYLALNRTTPGVTQTATGLQYKQLVAGAAGARPGDGDVALVEYKGRLADGTVFDRSARATPLAVAGVVPGFAEALKLMNKGARYRVWIPPTLGYGAAGAGPIPANALLVFDITLVDFQPAAAVDRARAEQRKGR